MDRPNMPKVSKRRECIYYRIFKIKQLTKIRDKRNGIEPLFTQLTWQYRTVNIVRVSFSIPAKILCAILGGTVSHKSFRLPGRYKCFIVGILLNMNFLDDRWLQRSPAFASIIHDITNTIQKNPATNLLVTLFKSLFSSNNFLHSYNITLRVIFY